MNRTYEIMFIVRPDVEEADLDKLIEGFSAERHRWWRRGEERREDGPPPARLHRAQVQRRLLRLLNVAAAGSLITEIERRLRVSEQVIKFITVRMDEEEKRLAKIKAIRDTKVKRSAQPIAAPGRLQLPPPQRMHRRREEASSRSSERCFRRCLPRLLPRPFNFCLKRFAMMAVTASHNASRSPNFASTRPILVECSETPMRVWSGGRHNVPEREIYMADETNSTQSTEQHAPASRPSGGHSGHSGPGAGPAHAASCWRSRRRPWRPQVLPAQEGLQVLHREDRRHLLPRCSSAAGFCRRARQDRSAPPDRCVHTASAPAQPGHQAVAQHRPAGLCCTLLTFPPQHGGLYWITNDWRKR